MAKKENAFLYENKTPINVNTFLDLDKRRMIFFSIMVLLGLGLIGLFLALFIPDNNKYYVLILVAALAFVIGGGMILVSIFISIHRVKKHDFYLVNKFNEEEVKSILYRDNSKIHEADVYYSSIYKYKETKLHLFLYLTNRKSVVILKDENFDKIKELIKLENFGKKVF